MPGLVKIGMTAETPAIRAKKLSASTGVPTPFYVHYAAPVRDRRAAERLMHGAFAHKRVRRQREFFEMSPDEAVKGLRLLLRGQLSPRRPWWVMPVVLLIFMAGASCFWVVTRIGGLPAVAHYIKAWRDDVSAAELLVLAAFIAMAMGWHAGRPRRGSTKRRKRR